MKHEPRKDKYSCLIHILILKHDASILLKEYHQNYSDGRHVQFFQKKKEVSVFAFKLLHNSNDLKYRGCMIEIYDLEHKSLWKGF